MRSSNRQYLHSVDHLRAFAALLVVFFHASGLLAARIGHLNSVGEGFHSNNPFATLIYEGHTAVTLFMVLSGFIFAVGTIGHGVSFTRFMGNRLLRIYPLFILLLFVGLAFAQWTFSPGALFISLFGFANYPGALNVGAVGAMFWAVAIEMQFYLLFPLFNKILTKSGFWTFAKLLAAVIVVRGLVWFYSPTHDPTNSFYFNIAGRIDDFLIGMMAAWLFVHHRARFRGWWKFAIAAAIVLTTLWQFNVHDGFGSTHTWRLAWIDWEGGMWALVILTYVATLRSTNFLSRLGARVGEMSYSIYLLHFTLIQIIMKRHWYFHDNGLSDLTNALLSTVAILVPILLVISVITYQGVELPFLKLRMKYLLPLEPAPAAPAQLAQGNGRHQHDEVVIAPRSAPDDQPAPETVHSGPSTVDG
jgi:peptidoglycan/LPS O-acetylase OafA/YrhL